MLRRIRRRAMPLAVAVMVAAVVVACGSDDGDDASGLGTTAERGRELAEDRGCVGCHRTGGGGIGPDWAGLYGSTVTLKDGSTVVADEEYLTLAITDPEAQIVEGYDIKMPAADLSDDEVAALVAYLRELAP